MASTSPKLKRSNAKLKPTINDMIEVMNADDRFHLLEDDTTQPANLENAIHPIFFQSFDCHGPLKRTLQLASQFISHDSLLSFWVPLVYGQRISTKDDNKKQYLSNPFLTATNDRKAELIKGVRESFHCLAHSIDFEFVRWNQRVYARTLKYAGGVPNVPLNALANTTSLTNGAAHTSDCFAGFRYNETVRIEINHTFLDFYTDPKGYAASSQCAQLRHDFLLAATLVHELAHAVGIMRRGNIDEPYVAADHPDNEWGHAWEHFMFGAIINPQDTRTHGTHLLMKRPWVGKEMLQKTGGKEHSDVSMAYIAQWFRRETWDAIAKRGPEAIAPPANHFKIQRCADFNAWIVSSGCAEIKEELADFLYKTRERREGIDREVEDEIERDDRVFWRLQTEEELQRSMVVLPERVSSAHVAYLRWRRRPVARSVLRQRERERERDREMEMERERGRKKERDSGYQSVLEDSPAVQMKRKLSVTQNNRVVKVAKR